MTVYLPALGIVNALGRGHDAVLRGLLAGSRSGMIKAGPMLSGRSTVLGRVAGDLPAVPPHLAEFDCRNNQLMAAALAQIEPSVQDSVAKFGPERVAVVVGTSTSGIAAGEQAFVAQRASGAMPATYHYRQQEGGTLAEFTSRFLGLRGPHFTVSTACSSSAKVLASAARLMQADFCDAVVVGGCDSLCELTVNGFDALESVSSRHCNPFSVNRDGINLGEGAAVMLMTREAAAIRLCGTGEASDGYHMSAPDPQGGGATLAIRKAMASAGIAPDQIGYLNLHGTATPQNDAMESRVVAELFGPELPCSSTKSQLGHTLGAAGAQEIGLCWLLLSDANGARRLPHHIWDGEVDPTLPRIGLTMPEATFEHHTMMSNSFAFGGSNVSVIIGRA